MARIETDLIVKAVAEGFSNVQGELRETGDIARRAGDAAEDSGSGAGRAGLKWTELASMVSLAQQAYQGVSGAVDMAMEALERGAELDLARDRFDRLAGSIGQVGDALLNDLRGATSGMVSDAELMASSADIMRLGLADTGDGVVELATLISELGLDMQQVILTFANDSVMRLDALGLSVEGVTTRAKELEASGIDMTKAFDLAVIEGLKEQLALVGSAADTTAGDVRRLKADWQNMKDEMVQDFASEVDLKSVGEDVRELSKDMIQLTEIALKLIGPLQKLADVGRAIMEFPLSPPGALLWLIDFVGGGDSGGGDLGRGMRGAKESTDAYAGSLDGLGTSASGAAEGQREFNTAAGEATGAIERGVTQADEFSRRLAQLSQGTGIVHVQVDTEDARTELETLINDYTGKVIPFEVLPTIRGRGGEHAQGEEIMQPVKDALGDIFDDAVVDLQPQIDMTNLIEMESQMGNIIENVDYVNITEVAPPVNDVELQDLITDIGVGQGALDDLETNGPYNIETESNIGELNEQLLTTLGLVQSIAGTHNVNFVMGGTTGGSGGGQGGSGGSTNTDGGDGGGGPAPQVTFIGTSPEENARYLQDRGLLPRTTFR